LFKDDVLKKAPWRPAVQGPGVSLNPRIACESRAISIICPEQLSRRAFPQMLE
jgi:hypothetical protein